MTIIRISLKFHVPRPIFFHGFSGFLSRGLLYELIRCVDAKYAERLHSSGRLSPFATTPIMVLGSKGGVIAYKVIPGGSVCMVHYTFLEEKPASIVLKSLIEEKVKPRLVDIEVKLVEVSVSHVKYSTLLEEARAVRKFMLEFITPTYFRFSPQAATTVFPSLRSLKGIKVENIRKASRFHPLPEPILMMRSLVRLWRSFTDRPFDYTGYLSWISIMGVSLAGYPSGIKTQRLYEHETTKKFVVGFTGKVNFSIPEDLYSKRWAKITDALLKFAEYSNLGGGRTAGFGIVRYKPKEYYS